MTKRMKFLIAYDGSICADSPAWGIIKKAEEWQADLVVMGSHGHSALGRLILGSVSQRVLIEAPCPVRVARGRIVEKHSPVQIVIGVDGSLSADIAVNAVAVRMWPTGSKVRMTTVIDSRMSTAVAHFVPSLSQWLEKKDRAGDEYAWVHKITEVAADRLRAAGMVVSSIVKEGDPKRVLVEEAEHWMADCIFVGARGLGGLGRFLLGGVSAAVAARAHCCVEVVRPGVRSQVQGETEGCP